MSDISLTWNSATGYADWSLVDGDLATGGDLLSAVLLSLFTDLDLPAGMESPDGSSDRRGWWANRYEPRPYGSLLWTLFRSKIVGTAALANTARIYAEQALQWLVDDGVVATLTVTTGWVSAGVLGMLITLTEPSGPSLGKPFRYSFAWNIANGSVTMH